MSESKTFTFEFRDEGEKSLSFEYSPECDEELTTTCECTRPLLTLNPSGCLALAKVLIKLAHGRYPNGYRVYIREHFDGNRGDALVVELSRQGETQCHVPGEHEP